MSNIKSQLKNLMNNFKQVFVRFPLACFFFLMLSTLVSYLFIKEDIEHETLTILYSLMWGCGSAGVLTFAFGIFCRHHHTQWWHRILGYGIAIAISACFGFLCFNYFDKGILTYYAFTMVFIVLLILLWLPMIGKQSVRKVWNWHARLVLSVIAAFVLASIVALSVWSISASIEFLFKVDIEVWMKILIPLCFCFIFPCCIMALIPTQEKDFDRPLQYHKITRILALYILLPLICVEGLILYIYAFRILFQWELPNGGVAYLVFSYAIIGTLIWYLLMPAYLSKEKLWGRFFFRTFFYSLVPLLGLLFVGLFRRIGDYGFTTNRYLVLVMAYWFIVMALYMIIRKSKNVTPWLISLTAIAVLLMFGPWSMFSVPQKVQTKHFEKIATEYNILVDNHLAAPADSLSLEQNIALSQSLDFLLEEPYCHEFTEQYFALSQAETDTIKKQGFYSLHNNLMQRMNGQYIHEYDRICSEKIVPKRMWCNFVADKTERKLYDVSAYDYSFSFNEWNADLRKYQYLSENKSAHLQITTHFKNSSIITFTLNNRSVDINPIDSLQLDFVADRYNLPLHQTIIVHEDKEMKLYMDVQELSIVRDSLGTNSLNEIKFNGLVKLKQ